MFNFLAIIFMKVFGIERALKASARRHAPGLEKNREQIDQLAEEINILNKELLVSHEIWKAKQNKPKRATTNTPTSTSRN